MKILTLNCRSFFISYQLLEWTDRAVLARGIVDRVELGDSFLTLERPGQPPQRVEADCPDHRAAIDLILQTITDPAHGLLARTDELAAVGHRVVHGGETFARSTIINDRVVEAVHEMEDLAPLHNPPNVTGIRAALALLPAVPQVAVFDTAFHQTMPAHAFIYPLPYEWYEHYGIRRYGFHGAAHCYAARRGAALLGRPSRECNLVTVHIGTGISICAIKGGESVDTSMGLTPLEGTMMGTRCGDIDPGIVPFMMQEQDFTARDMDRILNQKSGAAGITGNRLERPDYLARAAAGDERCLLAAEMEAYRLKKYLGAYTATLGRLDAVIFSAGTGAGEWLIREKALSGMELFGVALDREKNRRVQSADREEFIGAAGGAVPIYVIPTEEEMVLAEEVAGILGAGPAAHFSPAA
ncbi:acetate kinase [Geotalea uraniireducens]|uniref:Acetate kinase n=1 Tax=Geotalea uraniireducens TaxID=351604 RepID=A0ABM8EQX3_9BACT|nr:acetate kinase [Geotalea uraniireducens]BDV44893.1 acetate kinase [Geotalea uraniireducens]